MKSRLRVVVALVTVAVAVTVWCGAGSSSKAAGRTAAKTSITVWAMGAEGDKLGGLAKELTLTMVEAALLDRRSWAAQGLDITVAVNIAPRCLRDPDLRAVLVRHDETARTVVVHRGAHRVVVNRADEPRTVDMDAAGLDDLVVLLSWADQAALDGHLLTVGPGSAALVGPEAG